MFIIKFGLTHKYKNDQIARHYIKIDEEKGNRLLDSYQLIKSLETRNSPYSADLILDSVKKILTEIRPITLKNLLNTHLLRKKLRSAFLIPVLFIILLFVADNSLIPAYNRIKNYSEKFLVPTPFSIKSLTEDINIFGGDTVKIAVQVKGKIPASLKLKMTYSDFISEKFIEPDEKGVAQYAINAVTRDFDYEVYAENHSLFKPWRKITSGIFSVNVKDRPEILNVSTTIIYPGYTGIGKKSKESSNSEYFVMPGSKVSLAVELNKPVAEAWLNFLYRENVNLQISKNRLFGEFEILKEDQYQFWIADDNGITNINPITYKIKINPDNYPTINLLTPREDFQLSEQMEIPLHARISDDFGFTKAFIHYKLLKKFGERKNEERDVLLPIANKKMTLQEITHVWNVSNLNLTPEDGVEFFIELYDNDIISGPKKATSRKVTAFFPSLSELFSNVDKEQQQVENSGEEILTELLSSKKVLEDISNKLIKDPKLTWEQKEQLQREIEKTKAANKKIQKLAEKLQDIKEEGEKNQLFSEETLKKYADLQQAFQELVTPELSQAMKELQNAMEKMDNKSIQQAVQKFKTNHDEFSKELDRMLELMKRVKIEQSVDELVKRIEDLTKRQDSVSQNLQEKKLSQNKDWNALQKEEQSLERDTKIFEDKLQRTAEAMKDFPLMNGQKLNNMQQQMQDSGLYEDMKNSQQNMQMRQQQQAQNNTQQAGKKLSQIQEQMQQFQQEFQQNNMQEVEQDFQRIISKSLALSQQQEALNQKIAATSRLSDQLPQLAKEQNQNRQNLAQLVSQMTELSQKTFGVSSESMKNIGGAANEMQKAIASMEQRSTHMAARHGKSAGEALNKFSLNMMNSLDELQQSGQSSGFDNYMKQMEEMAQQQQGLNQDTQQMGQGMPRPQSGGSREQYLQQLAARQQQIQQSLQQLQQEMEQQAQQQAGTLQGIAKDMEDVVKELQQNKVLRKTLERQQQILTRMLEAQKSLRTQSFKKERESRTATDIVGKDPGELPEDLGEKYIILRQKLEDALQSGYSPEYKEIIRKYFEELATEETTSEP